MNISLHFPAAYNLQLDPDLPSAGADVIAFKLGSSEHPKSGIDGPLLLIEPRVGKRWFAMFSGRYPSDDVVHGLFSTPNPDVVCVVSMGAGFWVHTVDRTKLDVPVFPIRQLEIVDNQIIYVGYTKLSAFGFDGPLWHTGPIVSDRLRILQLDSVSKKATCEGWNAYKSSKVTIEVSVETGRIISEQYR